MQTLLTDLQISRVRHHLGLSDYSGTEWLEFKDQVSLKFLPPIVILQVVGREASDPSSGDRVTLFGQDLCEDRSLLAKTEAAWDLLDSVTIENSQKVVAAGSVTLRQSELPARQRLYRSLTKELGIMCGVSDQRTGGSVGY